MPPTTYDSDGLVTSSYDTTLDPNLDLSGQGGLPCSSLADGGASCDPGYACSAGKCVIPLHGAVGLGINTDGTTWWGQPAPGGAPAGTAGKWGQCDETCQRWVSACVLSRTNAYGVHVEISMRAPANAPDAIKKALATSANLNGNPEVNVFWKREGAYYGNIFETKPVASAPSTPGGAPEAGSIALVPTYTACAGPESNVPQITKRFESSQGDQVVIKVPGVCLATADEPGACAGSDTDTSSSTYGSIQHCYTDTSLTSSNACSRDQDPSGGLAPNDPTCYDEVITVFLADAIAVCGNGICEPPGENSGCCPTDCHPKTWAKDFSPLLQTGDTYVAPPCNAMSSISGSCTPGLPIKFTPDGMSALADDNTVAIVGNASVDICSGGGCPLTLGDANLPASQGVGVLVKYNDDGTPAWTAANAPGPVGGVRFGATPPASYVDPLKSVAGVVVGTNATSPATSPDHAGNITVAGLTTQVGSTNEQLWISSFSPDGNPLGSWIPQLLGGPTLSPYGGTLAFDSQSNLVLALDATNLQVQPTAISSGGNASCALLSGGMVECWGQNGYSFATSAAPSVVPGLTGATALSIMDYAACALQAGGTVKCWGQNSEGELGNGTTASSATPVAVSGLTTVTALASAGYTACALKSDGTVWCWGSNAYGQLGNGTNSGPSQCSPTDSSSICSETPVEVLDPSGVGALTGVTAISVGQYSACALLANGNVDCWGANEFGRLGNGGTGPLTCGTGPCSPTPVQVLDTTGAAPLTGATAISVGLYSSCAVLGGGAVACWGDNSEGELGDATATGPQTCSGQACSTIPVAVTGLPAPATQISVGVYFACALLSDGTVDCWGDNAYGSLGIGSQPAADKCNLNSQCSTKPVAVKGLTGVTSLSPSGSALNTCARLAGGAVDCWGDNYFGRLGNGAQTGPQICSSGTDCAMAPVPVSSPQYYAQTNTLVLKISLPAGSAEAPVVWVAPLGGSAADTTSFPQSLSIDPKDNVVVVSQDTMGSAPQGLLRKICSDGTTGPTCPDGTPAWTNAAAYYTAAAIKPAALDATGAIYAAAVAYSSSNQFGVPFVQKFDTNGASQWLPTANASSGTCPYLGDSVASTCMSQPAVQGVRVGFDGSGNVILASFGNPAIGGGISFGTSTLPTFPTYGSPNIFLSAYDSVKGGVEWAKQIQTILSGSLHGMALGKEGQVILAGNYSGSMQVDGQLLVTGSSASPTVVDSFLASFAEPLTTDPKPDIGTTDGTCGGLTFSTVPEDISVPATSKVGACVFFMPPTATWATAVTCTQPPNTTFKRGPTQVKCTAYDAYGNSKTSDPFTINVTDPAPPRLTNVPQSNTYYVTGPTAIHYKPPTVVDQLENPESCSYCVAPPPANGSAAPAPASGAAGPAPPCVPDPVFADCTPPPDYTFPLGQTPVTCTTTDVGGRTASASFTVTLLPQVTATCVGAPGAPVTIPTPAGTCGVDVSNASSVAGTCSGSGLQSCTFDGQASETLAPGSYAIPVVATAADLTTTSACTSYVKVVDNQAPVITCAPLNTECMGNGGATVTPTSTCTDNCSCTSSCTTGFFPLGTSTGSCMASDAAPNPNTATCQPSVTVVDSLPPHVTVLPGPSKLQCRVDTWSEPGATALDQCAGDLSSSIQIAGFVDPTHVGSYTETYKVFDPAGHLGQDTRAVSVVDTLPPTTTATIGPNGSATPTVVINITSYSITPKGGGAPVTGSASCWTSSGLAVALKAVDACSIKQVTYALSGAQTGGATVAGGIATVPITAAGSTTVTYYATDSAGNVENARTLPVYVGHGAEGYGFTCSPLPTLKNLPAHGTVTAKGTVTITNPKTGKSITEPFSFTQSY
jgi:alpha-tubulin suppressor-like RCC1 family protein